MTSSLQSKNAHRPASTLYLPNAKLTAKTQLIQRRMPVKRRSWHTCIRRAYACALHSTAAVNNSRPGKIILCRVQKAQHSPAPTTTGSRGLRRRRCEMLPPARPPAHPIGINGSAPSPLRTYQYCQTLTTIMYAVITHKRKQRQLGRPG